MEKTPTTEIIKEMSKLEQQIDLLTLKYEKLRLELIRRYPKLAESEEFKPKEKINENYRI